MQTSYLQLEEEAAKLLKQAEELRGQERSAAIAKAKEIIIKYTLTSRELGLTHTDNTTQPSNKKAKYSSSVLVAVPKYRGPNNELWSGGRGRKPEWAREVLASGQSLEDYLIEVH